MADWDDTANQILRGVVSSSLGEKAFYQKHYDLEWFEIRGCVTNQYVQIDSSTGEALVGNHPTITVVDEDIPNGPEDGDKVRQRGKTYRVDRPEEDGHTAGNSLILKIIENA